MKRQRKVVRNDGRVVCEKVGLARKLNLNYLELTNQTRYVGPFDLPSLACNIEVPPDYIALYNQPGLYHLTPRTAVGFWLYDDEFDGVNGLYNAIYHRDERRLDFFRKRFEGVRIFFTPDYSQFGDVDFVENLYRLKKQRVVGLWFSMELGAVVIPSITVPSSDYAPIALQGLDDCHVVAFSTKGYATHRDELEDLKRLVHATVDTLDLDAIVVYDTCGDDETVNDVFIYPREQGVRIVVPNNTLREQNAKRKQVTR